jgi:hypothetical protein
MLRGCAPMARVPAGRGLTLIAPPPARPVGGPVSYPSAIRGRGWAGLAGSRFARQAQVLLPFRTSQAPLAQLVRAADS